MNTGAAQRVHFIAIGGSAMHNLAIALHQQGVEVSGSDDEIFEPSRSRLLRLGLLPDRLGWRPEDITPAIDAVILGMHARADNPELLRAQALGIPVFSYPSFFHERTRHKVRVVIGGSHGKTTITSMIVHVLRHAGMEFDYLVGAQLDGFDCMVKLSDTAPVAVIEGDEYLASALEPVPKFHLYRPHIALISGIAWDHVNVFRTYADYEDQFRRFIRAIEPGGRLIYCAEDPAVDRIAREPTDHAIDRVPYATPAHRIVDGVTHLMTSDGEVPLHVFGRHNLQNIEGARAVCRALGIDDAVFRAAIASFQGAARRLEKLAEVPGRTVYKDFAHSPSKLKATVQAVREQYPGRHLTAVMELHTYSSLSDGFMDQYAGTMAGADQAIVFYDPHAVELKRLPPVPPERIAAAFGFDGLRVLTDPIALMGAVRNGVVGEGGPPTEGAVLLMMSSGNFGGIDLHAVSEAFIA
ncbi:MAG: Mur ligase family protein [Flavobacteriales bacterium]|jgi:UDP-N-acetylmuramate: L-alanyl-gamma-D-glutamyl-meso-diaminopimelate ligase|nr:Mur ligase family protein [Flavobacteriales bacterium]